MDLKDRFSHSTIQLNAAAVAYAISAVITVHAATLVQYSDQNRIHRNTLWNVHYKMNFVKMIYFYFRPILRNDTAGLTFFAWQSRTEAGIVIVHRRRAWQETTLEFLRFLVAWETQSCFLARPAQNAHLGRHSWFDCPLTYQPRVILVL